MMTLKRIITQMAVLALLGSSWGQAALVTVTTDVTTATTWYATNTYLLGTVVYVRNNATLRACLKNGFCPEVMQGA